MVSPRQFSLQAAYRPSTAYWPGAEPLMEAIPDKKLERVQVAEQGGKGGTLNQHIRKRFISIVAMIATSEALNRLA